MAMPMATDLARRCVVAVSARSGKKWKEDCTISRYSGLFWKAKYRI